MVFLFSRGSPGLQGGADMSQSVIFMAERINGGNWGFVGLISGVKKLHLQLGDHLVAFLPKSNTIFYNW